MMNYLIGMTFTNGEVVDISKSETDARARLVRSQFGVWMFQYFQELNSHQCGWGINFNEWLEFSKGWKFIGRVSLYEKVEVDLL